MRYAFILNPSANRTRALASREWLQKQIDLYWPGSILEVTSSKSDISRAVKSVSGGCDVVIACGGDGTVNEVFSHCLSYNLIVGVIPMGSGNDFAKAAGFSTDKEFAVKQLIHAQPCAIDYIRYQTNVGQGYMFNTMGLGLDGQINHIASGIQYLKGALIYVYAALKSILSVRSALCSITIDGRSMSDNLVMVTLANGGVEGGNFRVAPHASNRDGQVDLLLLPNMPVWKLLPLLPLFLLGKQQWYDSIRFDRGREIRVTSEIPWPLHVDGEQCGLEVTQLYAVVHPSSLRVLMPKLDEPKTSTQPNRSSQ